MKNFQHKIRRVLLVIAGLLYLPAGQVNAAVLTFDIVGISNHLNIDQNYGDNITAITQGGFSYGSLQGLTPNITVSYGNSDPALWKTGFGTLENVLFEDLDNTGILEITLTALPGESVLLHSFDLAAFGQVFSADPTIDLVEVTTDTMQLFSLSDALISKSTFSSFVFSTPLQANELTIRIDARNLGAFNDDIAIDNIVFSSPVPVPASIWLFLSGLLGVFGLLNKTRS